MGCKYACIDLIHTSLLKLQKCNLIIYDSIRGIIDSTDLVRISSYYYVSYATINELLNINIINDIELFKMFSLSEEFKYISS